MIKPKADILFEVSYEVCNKVGGIYTVLSSKAAIMKELYPQYITIGPYYHDKARLSLEQLPAPTRELAEVFEELRKEGIQCIYGKWLIPGEPQSILIDPKSYMQNANDMKKKLWDAFGVDTLFCAYDFTEPMVWSWCVGKLIEKIEKKYPSKKIVTHCHEWLSGGATLYLKMNNSNVGTIFTTHATMLGRAIAGSGDDLYASLDRINPYEEAKKRNILDKFTTEKACAINSDVFTTVSEITGFEAEKILGRRPDVLVLNGLDVEKFPTIEGTSIKHQETREAIRDFFSYYFFPYYSFDLDESLTYFLLARPEFRNKGIDVYIKSLGRLNNLLKESKSSKTIISFLFVPIDNHGIKTSILENKNTYQELKNAVNDQTVLMKNKIVRDLATGKKIDAETLFSKNFMITVKNTISSFTKQGETPPLCTHNLHDEYNNEMINALKCEGLLNRAEDKVKVIVYPAYLSESDGILNMKYYDVVTGCHMGMFPSYYEPWGYTPLECAALGVPALTTDLAGFGRYIETVSKEKKGGIYVLKRYQKSEESVLNDFTNILFKFSNMKKNERVDQKVLAKEISLLADWSILVNNYIEAHNLSLGFK